jgi:hypothetical protein
VSVPTDVAYEKYESEANERAADFRRGVCVYADGYFAGIFFRKKLIFKIAKKNFSVNHKAESRRTAGQVDHHKLLRVDVGLFEIGAPHVLTSGRV